MCICGYHQKMGSGIMEFAEGLTLSLRGKSERLGLSMSVQMASEAEELGSLSTLLRNQYQKGTLGRRDFEAWNGLVNFVMYLMQPEDCGDLTRADFELAVHERARRFDGSMIRFENIFEANLSLPLSERLQLALSEATKRKE